MERRRLSGGNLSSLFYLGLRAVAEIEKAVELELDYYLEMRVGLSILVPRLVFVWSWLQA